MTAVDDIAEGDVGQTQVVTAIQDQAPAKLRTRTGCQRNLCIIETAFDIQFCAFRFMAYGMNQETELWPEFEGQFFGGQVLQQKGYLRITKGDSALFHAGRLTLAFPGIKKFGLETPLFGQAEPGIETGMDPQPGFAIRTAKPGHAQTRPDPGFWLCMGGRSEKDEQSHDEDQVLLFHTFRFISFRVKEGANEKNEGGNSLKTSLYEAANGKTT